MIRKLIFSVLMIWLITIVNGDSFNYYKPPSDDHNQINPNLESFSSRLEKFSLEILKTTYAKKPGNFIMSPISIWNTMSLLSEGANGNTLKEIEKVLRHPHDRKSKINDYQAVRTALTGSSGVSLQSKNAIFVSDKLNVSNGFKQVAKNDFITEYIPCDLQDSKAVDIINAFISNSTAGKISKFISNEEIIDAKMLLTNVIHFKGQWTTPFDAELTKIDDFYDEFGKSIGKLNYMHEEGLFPTAYIRNTEAFAVELPYGDERFSMIILLTRDGSPIQKLINALDETDLNEVYERLQKSKNYVTTAEVYLPRFKLSSDLKLEEVLKSMGIKDVFNAQNADLSKITGKRDLFASAVIQKAGIEVNEEGSEAYAATGALVTDRIVSAPFRVNRPFIFFIVERNTKLILFNGVYTRPELY